jgi:hypothetical protein
MSRGLNCDFIGFGELLRMRHPLRHERIKGNWREVYARTPIIINIDSRVVKI